MLKVLLVVAVVALGIALLRGGRGSTIPGAEARKLVTEGATLLDVRTREEYGAGHLDGAMNIPVSELAERLGEVPQGRPIVVYCRSGARSATAAGQLRAAGREVFDVGGMGNY